MKHDVPDIVVEINDGIFWVLIAHRTRLKLKYLTVMFEHYNSHQRMYFVLCTFNGVFNNNIIIIPSRISR